jgi:Protein of unknown function (DUF1488)
MLEQNCIGLETPWNSMHIAIMPEKQPKRPNNNAKALESWESEGGAPASDEGLTKGPRDLNQITKAQTDHKRKPKRPKMPLKRLKNEYLEQDGVRFLMEDEEGSTVACIVSHEALRDHAERVHLSDTDAAVFEAYRELIEQVASDAYDAEGPFDDHGRILVTSEALARVTRSA